MLLISINCIFESISDFVTKLFWLQNLDVFSHSQIYLLIILLVISYFICV